MSATGWYRFANDPRDMLRFWNGARWSKPHLFPADAFPHRPPPPGLPVPGAEPAVAAPTLSRPTLDEPALPATRATLDESELPRSRPTALSDTPLAPGASPTFDEPTLPPTVDTPDRLTPAPSALVDPLPADTPPTLDVALSTDTIGSAPDNGADGLRVDGDLDPDPDAAHFDIEDLDADDFRIDDLDGVDPDAGDFDADDLDLDDLDIDDVDDLDDVADDRVTDFRLGDDLDPDEVDRFAPGTDGDRHGDLGLDTADVDFAEPDPDVANDPDDDEEMLPGWYQSAPLTGSGDLADPGSQTQSDGAWSEAFGASPEHDPTVSDEHHGTSPTGGTGSEQDDGGYEAVAAAVAAPRDRITLGGNLVEAGVDRPAPAMPGPAPWDDDEDLERGEGTARRATSPVTPAPFARRLAARFVDTVIEWTIFLALLLMSREVSVGHRRFFAQLPGESTAPALWAIGAAIGAFFAWEVLWLSQMGATPGKRLFGLAVRNRTTRRTPPGMLAAAVRTGPHLFYGIPGAGLVVWIGASAISAVSALVDRPRRRSLFDRLGGTQVVIDTRGVAANRNGALAAFVAALTGCVVALAVWQAFHKPAIDEAAMVLEDLRSDRLAEATAAFADSCQIDRAEFAEFFTRNAIVDFELERAQIDWAVPLFSEPEDTTLAIVTGRVALSGDVVGTEALRILMVFDDGWKVCRFLGN